MKKSLFENAQEAFEYYYFLIKKDGIKRKDNMCLFDVIFDIKHPLDNLINTKWRKWSEKYAKREWEWYEYGDNTVTEIKKYAKIWDKMHSGDDIVNSNYGYEWKKGNQIEYVVETLKKNNESRRAVVSIYDGKKMNSINMILPAQLT